MMNQTTNKPVGRVVLMHGRSIQTLAAAQNLSERGLEVIGCDNTPLMALSFSKHVTDTFLHPNAEEDEERFLQSLEIELRERQPGESIPYVLMPIHRHTRLISKHRERFESFMHVTAPPLELIDRVFPKHHLVETARELGIPVPNTAIVKQKSELFEHIEDIGYPAFLKVPDGSGGRGLEKVDDKTELLDAFAAINQQFKISDEYPLLMQEGVEGDDYCFTGLFDHGEMKANMIYRNLQTFPSEGGFGVLRETVETPPLVEIADEFMSRLKWNGVVQIDFRWNGGGKGTAKIIEVNPRFWGGLFQSIESGIEYPWLLYNLIVNGSLDIEQKPTIGTRTKVPMLGVVSALQDAVADDEAFERIKDAWKCGANEISEGNITSGLKTLFKEVKRNIWDDNPFERFRAMIEEGKGADREFLRSDDPFVVLGLMYVFGSLIRYGKPPEEFNR